MSRERDQVATLSDELEFSKALVEGPIQPILATNPVVIQLRGVGLVDLAEPEH